MITDKKLANVKLIIAKSPDSSSKTDLHVMTAVYDTLDGSRPLSRPDIATEDETMILDDPKPSKHNGFDFRKFNFIDEKNKGSFRFYLAEADSTAWEPSCGKVTTVPNSTQKVSTTTSSLAEPPKRNATAFSTRTSKEYEDQKS